MLKPFEDFLLSLLKFFYSYTGSYGWSIVLLTIAVRIFLLPLTIKQTKSMIEAPKIQAKVKELQKKYGHDKKRLNEELLKFYQENKVDPFGGCLPLIIQIPIFWALFRMLLTNKDLKGASFYFIRDLSLAPSHFPLGEIFSQFFLALPYYLLLLLTIVTTYLPTKLVSTDPRQDKFALMMNVFLAFICWRLPAGVMLYWATTNILGLIQQYIQMKTVKEET